MTTKACAESMLVDSLAGAIRDRLLTPGEEKLKQLENRLTGEMAEQSLRCRAGHEELSDRLQRMEKELGRLKIYGGIVAAACAMSLIVAGFLLAKAV